MKTNYNTETLNTWIEFIEEIEKYVHESNEYERGCKLTFERKDFLKQSPKLGDFIATNKKGEVLEEPPEWMYDNAHKPKKGESDYLIQYQQAQERVKFEGWSLQKRWFLDGTTYLYTYNKDVPQLHLFQKTGENDWKINFEDIKTYSDLTGYGLKMIVR